MSQSDRHLFENDGHILTEKNQQQLRRISRDTEDTATFVPSDFFRSVIAALKISSLKLCNKYRRAIFNLFTFTLIYSARRFQQGPGHILLGGFNMIFSINIYCLSHNELRILINQIVNGTSFVVISFVCLKNVNCI